MDDESQLASLLGMRYKSCLSQNEHLLILKCGTYFNSVATGLGEIQDSVNEEIKSTVENINAIGKKISLLNKQINVIE